ncbi:MAG TPA: WD40 repeat domain-containing protein [bacterium]|nr:WD40 repeat domain-containing protein [bacterium]
MMFFMRRGFVSGVILFVLFVLPLEAASIKPLIEIGGNSSLTSAGFSPAGHAASGGFDGYVRLYRVKDGAPVSVFRHGAVIEAFAFSSDGKYMASAARDKTVKLWNAQTGALIKTFDGHGDIMLSCAFSPDSALLLAGTANTIFVYSTGGVKKLFEIKLDMKWARALKFSADGSYLAAAAGSEAVVWNVKRGDIGAILTGRAGIRLDNARGFDYRSKVYALDISRDSQIIALGGEGGAVYAWRLEDGMSLWSTAAHEGIIWALAFNPALPYFATGSKDGFVRLWGSHTGEMKGGFDSGSAVHGAAFSPDGSRFCAALQDGRLLIFGSGTKRDYSRMLSIAAVLAAFFLVLAGGVLLVVIKLKGMKKKDNKTEK